MLGLGVGLTTIRRYSDGILPMDPADLAGALAYHFEGDTGVTSASLTRIPGNAGGVHGVLSVTNNSTLQVTNQTWTYAGWFMVDSFATTSRCLMSKRSAAGDEWNIFVNTSGGVLTLATIFAAAPNFHVTSTGTGVTVNVPFFAAWGCDGTNQWVRLNNGTRATTTHSTTTHALSATTAPVRVGVFGTNSDVMTGGAGNIGYWRGKSLSDAELLSLYNSGAGVDYSALSGLSLTTNLISYWRMNERDGTRSDSHGTNHFANTQRCQTINAAGIVSKTPADGDTVSQWNDQSANARHLTAITAPTAHDYRPQYNATGLNSLPTLRFFGNQTLRRAFTLAQPTHLFLVVKPHNWNTGAFLIDGNTENAMGLKGVTAAPVYGLNAGSTGPSASLPIKQWSVVEACFNGASSFIRVNGGTKVTSNAGTATTAGFWLGVDGGSGLADDYAKHSDVEFAEVVCANAAQSDTDAAKLRRYLTNKWGGGVEGRNWPTWNPDQLVVVDGHSLSAGYHSGVNRSWIYTAADSLSGYEFLDLSYNDKTLATARSEFAARSSWAYDSGRSKNIYCITIEVGMYADASGLTAQQAWDQVKLHIDEVRAVGWSVIATTPPRFLASLAGAGYDARASAARDLILADTGAYDALVDIRADGILGGSGDPPSDSLYWDSDRTHFSWLGSARLGLIYATAIASL